MACLRRACGIAGVLILMLSGPAVASDPATALAAGELIVTVRDNSGILPGASVIATAQQTGKATTAVTDGEGVARFASLAGGTYDLRAVMSGFSDAVERGVEVVAGEKKEFTITLTLLQFSTTVTVVTANRREELLLKVADPTTVIDQTQIEDTGARTAKDLLVEQTGSGVQVAAGGGQGHVSLNGIPNSGVLVLVDGRRYLGKDANGNLNLEDIQLAGIERVEVVKGAASALYGSDALGGVINLITEKSIEPGFSNAAAASWGSYTDVRVADTLGYRDKAFGFNASGSYRTYDGFDLDEKNPQTIGQPESQFYTGNVTADMRLRDRLDLRFFGDYSRRNIDNYYFSGPTQLASTVYNSRRKLTRTTISPEAEYLVATNTSVTATATFGAYDRDETQIFSDRVSVQVPWREWNNEVKLVGRQGWRMAGQMQTLLAGYEYRDETLDRASMRVPETGESRASRGIHIGWLQQEFVLAAPLKILGGFRYDSYSDFGSKLSPKLSVVYSATPIHSLRASYGEGFRAPYFGELYLRTFSFVGNPDLKPERSETVSLGYTFGGPNAQLFADYFHSRIKDGITFDLRKLPYTYINLRRYVSQGANIGASVNLPHGFVPSVAYTYVNREDDAGNAVGGLPEHAAFVKLLWSNPRLGLRANLRGQMQNEVRYEDGTSQPGYQVWHARVSKTLSTRASRRLSVFVQVDNILNEKDIFRVSAAGEPIPGDYQVWLAPRTFLTGLTMDF